MKNLLTTLSLTLLVFAINSKANTHYVSTTGSDSNPGTIASPFKTWTKLASVLSAGDTGYIRGGTYTSPVSSGLQDWIVTFANLHGTSSSHIVITNYPNETPVLDLNGFSQTRNTTALRINECDYLDIYGIRIQNVLQTGGNIIAGIEIHACVNIKFERVSVHNIGGAGVRQAQMNGIDTRKNDNFTYVNCDASWCADPTSTGGGNYGNADGFDCNEGTATYIGCRAWWNSDDGFDCFYNDNHIYYKNCWSFRNGYVPGTYNNPGAQADGMGFKWGMTTTDQSANILRTYTNCIAFDNKLWGFDQNAAKCKAEFYNNTSYRNKAGSWATGYSITPREQSILRNNISFSDPVTVSDMSGLVSDHNTWNNIAASTASFASLDTSGVTTSRQLDASLPNIQFLHLSSKSNMINAGVSITGINLSFIGSAPDLGAFEYRGTPSPVDQPRIANAGSGRKPARRLLGLVLIMLLIPVWMLWVFRRRGWF